MISRNRSRYLFKPHYQGCVIGLVLWLGFGIDAAAQKSGTEISGDVLQMGIPAAAFLSTLIWNDNSRPTLQFVKSASLSVGVTYGLKWMVNKPRPNGGAYSFPSGHTSFVFTGAAFLHFRYGWKVGIPAYLLSSYVGWTRIVANEHDHWDIIGGAIIGIGSAYLFTKRYNPEKMRLTLLNGPKSVSIQLRIPFG